MEKLNRQTKKVELPMKSMQLNIMQIKELYDKTQCQTNQICINMMELSSVDKIIKEDNIKIALLTDEMISEILDNKNRVLIYKHSDSNEPNTLTALEIVEELNNGLYRCRGVKVKYGFNRTLGKKVDFVSY